MLDVPQSVLIFAIRVYQLTLSPLLTFLLGGACGCRYTPTCSVYATEALRAHGAVAGTVLAAKRICRCHPWGGCGHDPVPPPHEPQGRARHSVRAGLVAGQDGAHGVTRPTILGFMATMYDFQTVEALHEPKRRAPSLPLGQTSTRRDGAGRSN